MTDSKTIWLFDAHDLEASRQLAQKLRISPITAQLLINKGVDTPEIAAGFLKPDMNQLIDPYQFNRMQEAVDRILRAVEADEQILVYGDYDVDGTTATALMVHFFSLLGKEIDYYIPHRQAEGYSLNLGAIEEFRERGIDLVITVDCGTSSVAEVEKAAEYGIDVIITDHHEAPSVLPPAHTIINPKAPDAGYPWDGLCGIGVAFKLCWAIAQGFSRSKKISGAFEKFMIDAMGFVALGTVADVVPLRNENRTLVAFGLEALRHSKVPGIRALLEKCGLIGDQIRASDVAFRMGPRLNAGGRMDSASRVVELFTTMDDKRATELVDELEQANLERQRTERKILRQAEKQVLADEQWEDRHGFVLSGEGWHSGVIGIVASRIVDKFHRPTVMIAMDGDIGKGSARSITGFHLVNRLEECSDLLVQFGGHAKAAGLKIEKQNLDAFRTKFEGLATDALSKGDLAPSLRIGARVALSDVDRQFVGEYELLAPFGIENRRPLLLADGVRVAGKVSRIGRNQNHLSFYVTDGNGSLRAVGWNMGKRFDELADATSEIALVCVPKLNRWNGQENIELELKDFRVG